MDPTDSPRIKRLLVVLPSWVGDGVMATPTTRMLREMLPGAFIGALARPAVAQVLDGLRVFDEIHIGRSTGLMGPKRLAYKIRPRRYEAALLLTGSFSTALITRIAGIPRRIGYDRDGRGLLLTERLQVPKRRNVEPFSRLSDGRGSEFAPIPQIQYYYELARSLLSQSGIRVGDPAPMELEVTAADQLEANELLSRAGVDASASGHFVTLNPGGNRESKRWPANRWIELGSYLAEHHRAHLLVNGSPGESELTDFITKGINHSSTRGMIATDLALNSVTLTALKSLVARSQLVVTNDTGPRHIAAALGVPLVSLFGPTDPRWTTINFKDEQILVADPSLPETELADDHPERCRIDKIGLGDVVQAANNAIRSGPVQL